MFCPVEPPPSKVHWCWLPDSQGLIGQEPCRRTDLKPGLTVHGTFSILIVPNRVVTWHVGSMVSGSWKRPAALDIILLPTLREECESTCAAHPGRRHYTRRISSRGSRRSALEYAFR